VNLLNPRNLERFSSEYDPDIWSAKHLVDGRRKRGWCSAAGAKAPHVFVFGLRKARRIDRIVFDNDCPEEEEYRGVPAKGFRLEGSTRSANAGFTTLLEGVLERGKNNQLFRLATPTAVQWIRLTITGNYGHATLTELMEVRILAAAGEEPLTTTDAFHLDRVRTSRTKNGPALSDGDAFQAGERVWINFKPRAQQTNEQGKAWLEVDLVLEDAAGHLLLRRDKVVNHVAPLPKRPLSPFVSLYLDLPAGFPPGRYAVRVIGRDKVASKSAAARAEFVVATK